MKELCKASAGMGEKGACMKRSLFITGTDTGVGKTVVTGMLGRFLAENGVKVVTQKWVQTGCSLGVDDIDAHIKIMGLGRGDIGNYRSDMEPYSLKFPASPHLAASLENKNIDATRIERSFWRLEKDFEVVLVEGAGGFLVPINDRETMADIVERFGLSVLIVAGNRLGAINQTLLTVEAVKARGLKVEGIVFNRLSQDGDELVLKDNMRIVGTLTGEKVLGEITYNRDEAARYEQFRSIGDCLFRKP